jgi:hypothetical protein
MRNEDDFKESEVGMATRVDVTMVERGIEALRRARSEVWSRWGRRVSVCAGQQYSRFFQDGGSVQNSHQLKPLLQVDSALAT